MTRYIPKTEQLERHAVANGATEKAQRAMNRSAAYHTLTAEELERVSNLKWGEALLLLGNQTARNQVEVNSVTRSILDKIVK